MFTHQFLLMLDVQSLYYIIQYSMLLYSWHFTIKFISPHFRILFHLQDLIQLIPPNISSWVDPRVWATEVHGRAINIIPIKIQLKPNTNYPCKKQYLLKTKVPWGIQPVMKRFLKYGLLKPCQSLYNTTILPIKGLMRNSYLSKISGQQMKLQIQSIQSSPIPKPF